MENNETQTQTQTQNSDAIDYESEYKKMASDLAKMKEAMSKTNSENAEYKKKERERLSEEEKRNLEYNELVESKNKLENELKTFKLEKEFLANGFTAEETDRLIKSESSPKVIAEIIKAKVELAISSQKANDIMKTTQKPMGNTLGTEKTGFQKYQESKEKSQNIVKL